MPTLENGYDIFIASVVVSTLSALFAKNIREVLNVIFSTLFSLLFVNIEIDYKNNSELYSNIMMYIKNNKLSSSSYKSTENGDFILPSSWVILSKKLGCFVKFDEDNKLHVVFIIRLFIDRRFIMLKEMIKSNKKKDLDFIPKIKVYTKALGTSRCVWNVLKTIPALKPKLYFPNKLKTEILAIAKKFFSSKPFYLKNGLDYKKTFLFLGKPGTGKTSMIRYLAIKMRLPIYLFSYKQMRSSWNQTIQIEEPGLLVLEDFDRQIEHVTANKKLDISHALNFLDGLESPENVLIIITVNNVENIPPVLLRPGRINHRFMFPMLTEEVFNKIKKDHNLDVEFPKYEGISLAKFIQNHVFI